MTQRTRFTKKEWRILERALLKFTYTTDDEDDAPETDEEIKALWLKVARHRTRKGLRFPDEKV